ncbi:MAG: hypothetical protein ACHQ1H_04955, partial [Nitrososphaerales archaeon]
MVTRSTVSVIQTITNTLTISTQVQGNVFTTATTTENNSLSNLVLKEINTGAYPIRMSVNPKANLLYIVEWYGSTSLVIVNCSTNKIEARIPLQLPANSNPIVDSHTNLVYIGNVVVNGTNGSILFQDHRNVTFSGVDLVKRIVIAFASNNSSINSTSIIYE